ncbi:MAG: hypothetical protein AAGH71_07195 [Planctomycetota bacterium]
MSLIQRPIALALLMVSFAAFLVSAYFMAQRIARFNETELRPQAFFQPVKQTSFSFAGIPVQIRTLDDDPLASGLDRVEIRFGDERVVLDETVPGGVDDVQSLARHEEWLRVFRFALAKGKSVEEVEAAIENDSIDDRLVVVRRVPPPGANTSTWGEVWAKDWTFDFYELKTDGTIEHQNLKYPSGRSGHAAKPGELEQGTWQFDAALQTMPRRRGPKPQFTNDAVRDFGWTHAGVGFSAVLGSVAAAFLFAPRREDRRLPEREDSDASGEDSSQNAAVTP